MRRFSVLLTIIQAFLALRPVSAGLIDEPLGALRSTAWRVCLPQSRP